MGDWKYNQNEFDVIERLLFTALGIPEDFLNGMPQATGCVVIDEEWGDDDTKVEVYRPDEPMRKLFRILEPSTSRRGCVVI